MPKNPKATFKTLTRLAEASIAKYDEVISPRQVNQKANVSASRVRTSNCGSMQITVTSRTASANDPAPGRRIPESGRTKAHKSANEHDSEQRRHHTVASSWG